VADIAAIHEYDKLRPHLHFEHPQIKHSAYQPGEAITDVYFPSSSVYSVVAVADGQVVLEAATIGHEGMVGLPVFLGATSSPQAAFGQVAGETTRISVSDFRQALTRDGYLHGLLNRTHSTETRMARWLLTTQDRVGRQQFQLTQEFMAQMLGGAPSYCFRHRRATPKARAHPLQSRHDERHRPA
jgi:hypothetical protein